MEIWKNIPGYDDRYEVSDIGNVRMDKKYLLPMSTNGRYYTVRVKKDGKGISAFVHRLVAMAFVPNKQLLPEVNHINEITTDNRADNLEWCTHKYNCNYGTRIQRIKEKQNMAILQYTLDGEFVAEYASMHIAADAIKADAGHICDCCRGNRRFAYGYFWRYKDDALYERAKIRIAQVIERGKKSRAEKFADNAMNVIQLTMDGSLVAIHKSSKFAAEAIGSHRPSIINCCNGKVSHVKGYKFLYERDYMNHNN